MRQPLITRGARRLALAALALVLGVSATLDPVAAMGSQRAPATPAVAGEQASPHKLCNPNPPEYPGCTPQQINSWEVGTVDRTGRHYREDRWGQPGFSWANLGPAHDDKLRRLYGDAVDAFKAKHAKARPAFPTWNGAKAGTECSAGGVWGGLYTLNCRFTQLLDAVIPDVNKVIIYCAGLSVLLTGAGIVLTLVAPEAVPATLVGGAILCAIEKLYSKVFGGGKLTPRDQRVQQAAIQARLALLGAIEATPFGSAVRLTPEQRLLAQLNRAYAARVST